MKSNENSGTLVWRNRTKNKPREKTQILQQLIINQIDKFWIK